MKCSICEKYIDIYNDPYEIEWELNLILCETCNKNKSRWSRKRYRIKQKR